MSCCDTEYMFESVKIDTPAPPFDLPAYDPVKDDTTNISLADMHGKWTILFYYPADFTFVCPTELRDMANAKEKFTEL